LIVEDFGLILPLIIRINLKKNMQLNNKNLIKLTLCSILIYLNIGSIVIIGNIFKIFFCYTEMTLWWFQAIDILIEILRLAILIGLFSYFLRHFEFILNHKNLHHFLLINVVIFPLTTLINYGLNIFQVTLITKLYSVQFYGKYTMVNQIILVATNILNIIMMCIFGIIALNQKKVADSKAIIE
jgi:hypothetical protein